MNDRVKQLFTQVQQLSSEEQAELLDPLLGATSPPDPGWEKTWAEEAERRWQAYQHGETKTYSWEEVKAQLRKGRTALSGTRAARATRRQSSLCLREFLVGRGA